MITQYSYSKSIRIILLSILVTFIFDQPIVNNAVAENTFVPIRVNVGGNTLTDPLGIIWEGDDINRYYTTGNAFWACPKSISNTENDFLYCTYRWFNQGGGIPYQYKFPIIPPGQYTIRLHFAELYVPSQNLCI
jgi:Malectin domain